jgi:hypothetical protein
MEKKYFELNRKIKVAYNSCSLKTVNAFNPYQFEKMLEVLFAEFSQKGIEKEKFDLLLKISLDEIGAVYVK